MEEVVPCLVLKWLEKVIPYCVREESNRLQDHAATIEIKRCTIDDSIAICWLLPKQEKAKSKPSNISAELNTHLTRGSQKVAGIL
jgi:hypothetical protein